MTDYVDVYQWRYYCDTEAAWIDDFSEHKPMVCKNDAGHTLSTTKHSQRVIQNVDQRPIDQKSTEPTNAGYARLYTLRIKDDNRTDFKLLGNTVSTMTYTTQKYPMALYGMRATSTNLQAPDSVDLWVNRDTAAGVLAVAATAGDDTFTLMNPPVNSVAGLFTGFEIALSDGVKFERLGEIIDVDTANMKIKVDTPCVNNYAAYTTACLVSVHVVKDLYLGTISTDHSFGSFTQKSTVFPPETVCTIQYTNNHPQDAELTVYMESGYGSQNLGLIV